MTKIPYGIRVNRVIASRIERVARRLEVSPEKLASFYFEHFCARELGRLDLVVKDDDRDILNRKTGVIVLRKNVVRPLNDADLRKRGFGGWFHGKIYRLCCEKSQGKKTKISRSWLVKMSGAQWELLITTLNAMATAGIIVLDASKKDWKITAPAPGNETNKRRGEAEGRAGE